MVLSSAIILAGGSSTRLGQDKGLLKLGNKPLAKHVIDAVDGLVDEKILVVSSNTQARCYTGHIFSNIRVVIDKWGLQSPLVGALTGFQSAQNDYSILLSCDIPFLSRDILSFLLDLSLNKSAVVPRWPNGYIEPLQAVYCTKLARIASENALQKGALNMLAMIDRLQRIRYVSTLLLRQLDSELATFFNVNTLLDLKKAEAMQKRGK